VNAESWAASPHVQRGLVLESGGRLTAAAADLRTATEDEPTDYVSWALLARVQTERGEFAVAARDLVRAYRLRPDSGLFQR
jgi:cytochrome c-type biogenesis protein CcmH/NrfG